jgi:hypothetical protein
MFKGSTAMRDPISKRKGGRSIGARLRCVPCAASLWITAISVGHTEDTIALAQQHLYAGTLAKGQAELTQVVARQPQDATARFALGAVQFMGAVEGLAQAFYRHGLEAPRTLSLPILRLPVPPNPKPEPLTYESFRDILQRFANDLAAAEGTLAEVGQTDVKLPLDLVRVHLDLNGDGHVDEDERLWSILSRIDPRAAGSVPESFLVKFDGGDVLWLRGYAHLIMGTTEFWLAHDFQAMFGQSFHLFFPGAQLPFATALGGVAGDAGTSDTPTIADAVTFVHLFNWGLVERERLPRAMEHWRMVPGLSRQSWAAILAETDDDHEWLPNPRQTNLFPSLPITQEQIDAWLRVMDELAAVLEGRKLVPHWRFAKGVNVARALLEHRTFDPVLWITGPGITPFLEDGVVVTTPLWSEITRAFQGNFFGYALRFN